MVNFFFFFSKRFFSCIILATNFVFVRCATVTPMPLRRVYGLILLFIIYILYCHPTTTDGIINYKFHTPFSLLLIADEEVFYKNAIFNFACIILYIGYRYQFRGSDSWFIYFMFSRFTKYSIFGKSTTILKIVTFVTSKLFLWLVNKFNKYILQTYYSKHAIYSWLSLKSWDTNYQWF